MHRLRLEEQSHGLLIGGKNTRVEKRKEKRSDDYLASRSPVFRKNYLAKKSVTSPVLPRVDPDVGDVCIPRRVLTFCRMGRVGVTSLFICHRLRKTLRGC